MQGIDKLSKLISEVESMLSERVAEEKVDFNKNKKFLNFIETFEEFVELFKSDKNIIINIIIKYINNQ